MTGEDPPAYRSIARIQQTPGELVCELVDSAPVSLPAWLGQFLRVRDEIKVPVSSQAPTQFLQRRRGGGKPNESFYCSVGYVARPKTGGRGDCYLRAEVIGPVLGITSLVLSGDSVRAYFYQAQSQDTLYKLLQVPPAASATELRLGFRLAQLEQALNHSAPGSHLTPAHAFDLLAHPELRACHDALAQDPELPCPFPHNGFGSILVEGNRSTDGRSFFARRILSFLADSTHRQFRAPFRRIEFYDAYAVYRDGRRKVEVLFDKSVLPFDWDSTWNQWKQFAAIRIGISARFIRTGQYRVCRGQWELATWQTALPSSLALSIPPNAAEALRSARTTHHRLGEYIDAVAPLKARIEREPVDAVEVTRALTRLGAPGDFEPAMLTWRPDYEEFYFRELRKRARALYLFRNEYMFDWERVIAVEVPESGHATYLFRSPADAGSWVNQYASTTREAIRSNRQNIAEKLGFLGRVLHGRNPRAWLKELRAKAGEPALRAVAK